MIHTEHGFSLFELLIVLTITSILAAIAYPIYTHTVIKTRRTEAKIALFLLLLQGILLYLMVSLHSYYNGFHMLYQYLFD